MSLKKIWHKAIEPYRRLVLWGWDNDNNPSFLMLYGKHGFQDEDSEYDEDAGIERYTNVLEDEVEYTHYIVFSGENGHLPSFEAVNVVDEGDSYRSKEHDYPELYYKKDSRKSGYWRSVNEEGKLDNFTKLEDGITIPYFEPIDEDDDEVNTNNYKLISMPYEQLVQYIYEEEASFNNFRVAESPNEVIELDEELEKHYETLCILFSDGNLNTRKRMLDKIIKSEDAKKLYEYLFKLGSNELISGLFLELAKQQDADYIDKAQDILENGISNKDDAYAKGLKRCANIYLDAVVPERRTERINWIEENYTKADLPLIRLYGKQITEPLSGEKYRNLWYKVVPERRTERINWIEENYTKADLPLIRLYGKQITEPLSGEKYRNLWYKEALKPYSEVWEYHADIRRYQVREVPSEIKYEKGPFNDGVLFDEKAFKTLIQEAEVFKMPHVIGKLAYFVDAPRLTAYFKANGKTRALKYYARYLRRIMDNWAKTEPDLFIEAMQALFTSYTDIDYLGKFKYNFQFNYYIRHYLYYDFKEKAPVSQDWYDEARYEWLRTDNLAKLTGRYDYQKEIWDKYPKEVLHILTHTPVEDIAKACYFILKDGAGLATLAESMSIIELIKATQIAYRPARQLIYKVVEEKLRHENEFNLDIMRELIAINDKKVNAIAAKYFKRLGRTLTSEEVAIIVLDGYIDRWAKFVDVSSLIKVEEYTKFVKCMLQMEDKIRSFPHAREYTPQELGMIKGGIMEKPFTQEDEEYTKFVKCMLQMEDKIRSFPHAREYTPQELGMIKGGIMEKPFTQEDVESFMLSSIPDLSVLKAEDRNDIIAYIISAIKEKQVFVQPIASFAEKFIFSFDYEALRIALENIEVEENNIVLSENNKIIFSILSAIKNEDIPSDFVITRVLEAGEAAIVSILNEIIANNIGRLKSRKATMLMLLEGPSDLLGDKVIEIFDSLDADTKHDLHLMIVDSPVSKVYNYGMYNIDALYGDYIPAEFITRMLEHPAPEVKDYITDRINNLLDSINDDNADVFMYYVKTLFMLPNKLRYAKQEVYDVLYDYAKNNPTKVNAVQQVLMKMSNSNTIKDREKALVTLAKIRREMA